jgi:superfamily II DNA/RNA helicase
VLVRHYLTNPVVHSVDPAVAHEPKMAHHVFTVDHADKPSVIRELASGQRRSLLFTRTKHAAKKLAKQLTIAGLPAVELHGNLSQQARARNLAAFSAGSARVLVATDIAARGIHVDEIGLVVHVDPPAECKAYLHRSGRTARAGAEGVVVTLSTPDQVGEVRTLTRLAGIKPVMVRVRPGAEQIASLTGPPIALVLPPAGAATSTPVHAPAQPRRRQGGVVEASRRGPRRPTRRRSTRRAA